MVVVTFLCNWDKHLFISNYNIETEYLKSKVKVQSTQDKKTLSSKA